MRDRFSRLTLLAILGTTISAGQTPEPPMPKGKTFVISGTVVREGTGQPLKRVNVTITDTERREKRASLATSADGRFTFTDVPKGKYSLFAETHGIVRSYQQDDAFSTAIAVGPSLDSEHIVFPLPAATRISVKIVDEENEGVRAAQVWLFRRHISGGWPQVQLISQTNTDHAGIARFAHLEAGTYYVGAGGRPWYAQENAIHQMGNAPPVRPPSEYDVAYPVTYYPGTQDPDAASPVVIANGDSKELQIAFRPVPAVHISVADPHEQNQEQNGAQQSIQNIEAIGPGGIPLFSASGPGGVAPGRYRVVMTRFTPGQQPNGAGSGSLTVNATADMELNLADFPHTQISGRLSIDGGDGDPSSGPAIWFGQPGNGQHMACEPQENGAFRCLGGNPGGGFGDIASGRYELQLANTEEFYLKSLDVKGAAFTGGMLDVHEGATINLSVVVARGVTIFEGVAVRGDRAVSGAMILLVPQTLEQGVGIPRDQSDSDGTFKLHGVHPGKYWLLAIDQGHDLEYHNPKVLQPYLAAAKPIEISAAGSDPVQVAVQKRH